MASTRCCLKWDSCKAMSPNTPFQGSTGRKIHLHPSIFIPLSLWAHLCEIDALDLLLSVFLAWDSCNTMSLTPTPQTILAEKSTFTLLCSFPFFWVSRIHSGQWIRIQEGKKKPQKLKKVKKYHAECPLLRAEGFFCSLDVLYGGLGIGTVT